MNPVTEQLDASVVLVLFDVQSNYFIYRIILFTCNIKTVCINLCMYIFKMAESYMYKIQSPV